MSVVVRIVDDPQSSSVRIDPAHHMPCEPGHEAGEEKWRIFFNYSLFWDGAPMRMLGPPRSIPMAPGHFLGIPALVFRVCNDVGVAIAPRELGNLDKSCVWLTKCGRVGSYVTRRLKAVREPQAGSVEISELPGAMVTPTSLET